MANSYLTKAEAKLVVDAGIDFLESIAKLSARGLRSEGILNFASAVCQDKEPPEFPPLGGPRPLTIQAHSFLQDPRQYGDTYHLTNEVVTGLRTLLASDPEKARKELVRILTGTPRIARSKRPVMVVLDGLPGSTPTTATPLANATSITKSLSREIASDNVTYGAYQYSAFKTPLGQSQQFGVDLGRNLYVLAFSKKAAIAIARIASVKGRSDESVSDYIVYVNSAGQSLQGKDIPEAVWNCVRASRERVPPSARQVGVPISSGDPTSKGAGSVVGK